MATGSDFGIDAHGAAQELRPEGFFFSGTGQLLPGAQINIATSPFNAEIITVEPIFLLTLRRPVEKPDILCGYGRRQDVQRALNLFFILPKPEGKPPLISV